MKRLLLAATVLVGLAPNAPAADRVFVGYLFGDSEGIDFHPYTHVCHAFLGADNEGNPKPDHGVPNHDLARRVHDAKSQILLSLGGGDAEKPFLAMTRNREAEDRYVREILKLVRDFDYDGIDFDWEYPDNEAEAATFARMAQAFRMELDHQGTTRGRPKFLTMAASADPSTLKWLSDDVLRRTLDWTHVMTYDYAGPWTNYAGHNAPLYPSTRQPKGTPWSCVTTMDYLLNQRKIPADRLVLGIPLYGRGFAVAEPYASTRNAPKAKIPEAQYRRLAPLIGKGWTRQWDDQTQTPWLIADNHSSVIGYDDAESATIKARWATEHGLRGVFFWEIRGDRMADHSTPVQDAARKPLFPDPKPR